MKIIFAWDTTSHGGYHARRLSPPDLRTTLPDFRAAEKRSYASPYRAPNRRRSIDDQPRARHQGAILSHVERKSKYTKLVSLPDKTADAVVQASARMLGPLANRIETITYDN